MATISHVAPRTKSGAVNQIRYLHDVEHAWYLLWAMGKVGIHDQEVIAGRSLDAGANCLAQPAVGGAQDRLHLAVRAVGVTDNVQRAVATVVIDDHYFP